MAQLSTCLHTFAHVPLHSSTQLPSNNMARAGMLPFARELLKAGTVVILAANEEPCINDITAEELQEVVAEAAKLDALLSHAVLEQALRVVSSGNDLCVIDLSHVRQRPGLFALSTCARTSPCTFYEWCSYPVTFLKHSCAITKLPPPLPSPLQGTPVHLRADTKHSRAFPVYVKDTHSITRQKAWGF